MKKRFALFFCILSIVCFLSACGPSSESGDILLPNASDISKVTLINGDVTSSSTDPAYIEKLLRAMANAKDTGLESVQDRPSGDTALQIDFTISSGQCTIFMYFNGGKLFLEQPYEGIYTVDKSLADIVYEMETHSIDNMI